jgi:hypothetical protein
MSYSFDIYGWYSEEEIVGRTTKIAPPPCGEKVVGEPYPNFTGYDWMLLPYVEPIPPEPAMLKVLTPLQFLNRFTDDEAKAILALSKTNPDVELWWIKYNKALDIDLTDSQTISGVRALELLGVIAQGRANEILKVFPA